MRVKRFLVAWAAYVIVTFAAGFIWHLVLFKQVYRDLGIFSRIDDPVIPLGLTAMLIQGAVLAYLYPRLSRHRHPIADGLRFGVLMGVLMLSSAVIAEAAKQRVASLPTWLIVESGYYLLQFGVSGLCIGLAYGRVHDAAEQGVEADEAR
jgi:hypothetical protein